MEIQNIYYSSHFAKAFKKLPSEIKKLAINIEKIFRKDCFNPKLKTHKLKGGLKDYWSFSINHSYRVLFAFQKEGEIAFVDIGTHSIYG